MLLRRLLCLLWSPCESPPLAATEGFPWRARVCASQDGKNCNLQYQSEIGEHPEIAIRIALRTEIAVLIVLMETVDVGKDGTDSDFYNSRLGRKYIAQDAGIVVNSVFDLTIVQISEII